MIYDLTIAINYNSLGQNLQENLNFLLISSHRGDETLPPWIL
jgi:hypothetical protein